MICFGHIIRDKTVPPWRCLITHSSTETLITIAFKVEEMKIKVASGEIQGLEAHLKNSKMWYTE